MYDKELKRILRASQNNALTFFVGAGVSALSGAPTWKGLIYAISEKLGRNQKEEYSTDDCLQIPQMYYYSLKNNKEEYYRFIEGQLNSSDLTPNMIHREMLNLNPVSFITTNYDTLLEDAAIQYCQSFKVISRDEDVPTIFGDRFILKIHGDFKHKNFVLKEEDYLNYSENFKLIETLLKSIFSTNTVVFIGYGINDYNIKLILNWTKTLLKDSFQNPIFLYTGENILADEEIIYHESKGLKVIEWNKLFHTSDNYLSRYQTFFSTLKNHSKLILEGKSEDEAFEILYNRLKPLNRLNALRIEDVSKRLSPYVRIGDNGVIFFPKIENRILKKFFVINQMPEAQRNNCFDKDIRDKYNCILEVFRKARIFIVEEEHKYRRFIAEDEPFADRNCILFDYTAMHAFSEKEYKLLDNKYKKAFYLSRLKRYDEAFFLFSEVAKQAFLEKDYLLYYFAETNCLGLHRVIKSVNTWYRCYNLNAVENLSPNESETEDLFRRFPVEFRNAYNNLSDIHSANMLYRYSYEASIDGQKLQKAVESESMEIGLTSSDKAISRINNYLHFILGNGLVIDVFLEYRSTIKNLMSLLVYKYSTQGKKILHDQLFSSIWENDVCFDEIDFYCFVDCFEDKEILTLLNKYHIETIEFQNKDLIEISVGNLIDYYEYVVKTSKKIIDVISLQNQIKNCLVMLRYISVSQKLVDRICEFILMHEFRNILIDDKVLFLEYQLARRKKYSKTTAQIVENALLHYLDKHISALKNNETFELPSSSTGINYCNLVNYISAPGEKKCSRKLSMRVTQIINNNLSQLFSQITQHYCGYVSEYQQKKLVKWANSIISDNFSFDLFGMLVSCNSHISSKAKAQLKSFLLQKIEDVKTNNNDDVIVYPTKQPYEELDQVGYWCLINVLNEKDFEEFLGNSAAFDFYCKYSSFDFSRFDVSWLLNLYPHALEQIAKDLKVKEHIRLAISNALKDKTIVLSDSQKLQNILVEYFC